MKKGLHTLALLSAISLGTSSLYGQAGIKKADKEYDRWAYVDSQELLEKVLKRGHESKDLLEKVANTYYFNGRYTEAQAHYERLFSNYASE